MSEKDVRRRARQSRKERSRAGNQTDANWKVSGGQKGPANLGGGQVSTQSGEGEELRKFFVSNSPKPGRDHSRTELDGAS